MKSPCCHHQTQSGVALIMAILIVALATILAVGLASEGYMDQRRTATHLSLEQAMQIGMGGEAAYATMIKEDTNKQDTTADIWIQPRELPIRNGAGDIIGTIKGQLEDLQGRFNLNGVLNPDGTHSDEAIAQFRRLLELNSIDTKFATQWADWIDNDTQTSIPDGAEDNTYGSLLPPHLTANLPVTRTSELMQLPGFKYEDFLRIEPFITALPLDTKLNVCTASGMVLDSLATAHQEFSTATGLGTLVENRKNGCFPDINTLSRIFANDPGFTKLIGGRRDYLAETTSYFRANMVITLGTVELPLYSVLYRIGTGDNARTQIIQRNFYIPY